MIRFKSAILALLALLARSAVAQVDFGTAIGPDALPYGYGERTKRDHITMTPLALATSLALDATAWATISVSTSNSPAQELFRFQQKGYYKLEIFQIVLIAQKSRASIQSLADERDKGKRLQDIAKAHDVDFDANYDDALKLDSIVESKYIPEIMTVSVSTAAAPAPRKDESAPAALRKKSKRRKKLVE